jgi:hypothetical protein
MPLIGTIDADRSQRVLDAALQGTIEHRFSGGVRLRRP